MAKDYKDSPSPRADSRLAHPMLLGMIIGLLLGILISLSVALWLNRLSNPFIEKARPVDTLPHAQGPEPARAPEHATRAPDKAAVAAAPATAPAEDKSAPGRPRFEFYQILPGEKGGEKEAKAAPKAPAPPVVVAKPGSSPAVPKPHSGDTYWLQAGAFSDQKEADNQKARIALTGLEAVVRPIDVANRGTLYRVRLGPYQSLDDANRMKSTLAQNGVATNIIHTPEDAKNP